MSLASREARDAVRLAIVGSGAIAGVHAAAISQITNGKLTAICSRNREKAKDLARASGARVTSSLEELLAWEDVDAVLIATASGVHAEAALPALRARKHVLCEKPLEISLSRVRQMIEEAERAKVLLGGFFPRRFGAGALAIRHAVETGRFGRLTFLSARVKWWRDQNYYDSSSWRGTWALDGGGALMNQGIHAVDLLQWLGGRVEEVSAFSATLAHPGIEVEDTLSAALRFASGALGTMEAATSCHPGLNLSLEISGDRGSAILADGRIEFWRFAEESPEDEAIRSGQFGGETGGGASDPMAISCEGHRRQVEAFCDAIRGQPVEWIDGREAATAVAIIEAIYRSVHAGKSEFVSYYP